MQLQVLPTFSGISVNQLRSYLYSPVSSFFRWLWDKWSYNSCIPGLQIPCKLNLEPSSPGFFIYWYADTFWEISTNILQIAQVFYSADLRRIYKAYQVFYLPKLKMNAMKYNWVIWKIYVTTESGLKHKVQMQSL